MNTVQKTKTLSTLVKWSIGMILATFIMKFIMGLDVTTLVQSLSATKEIGTNAIFHGIILLVKTIVMLPLSIGIGVLLMELLDTFASKAIEKPKQ